MLATLFIAATLAAQPQPALPTPTTLPAQPLSGKWSDALKGQWSGSIELPNGQTLGFVLTVTATDTATIAIPQQSLPDTPLTKVAIDTAAMAFSLKIPGVPEAQCPSWSLTPAADSSSASGTMQQAGMTLNVTAKKLAEGEKPVGAKRPQTPKGPFPYTTKDVSYTSFDGAEMNGTLTLPASSQTRANSDGFPCILFITGSGTQDRDETLFEHKPFAVLADALARDGIASLRVDDRGWNHAKDPVGKDATSETFGKDIAAGVEFLLKQPDIDRKRIGLLGHSEGGLIAPAVAAAHPDQVSFIVLLAGPGVPGDEVLERQMSAILMAGGAPKSQIELAAARQKVTLAAVMAGDTAAARQSMREAIGENASAAGIPVPEGKELEDTIDAGMKQLDSPWMRHFLTRDPRTDLKKVKCPVLAINGGKDAQVVASQNLPEIVKTLLESGNTAVTARVFPNLNHLFQPCKTGSVAEYAAIETTMDPRAIHQIVEWVKETASRK